VSPAARAVADSATMLRRQLQHMRRYPTIPVLVTGLPVVFLLLFVYVFGGALGAGLGHLAGGRGAYAGYVAPGVLMLTVASAAQGTALSVAMDMAGGIMARLRTMPISQGSVLAGHVLGSTIQSLASCAAVTGVALLTGFRPGAGAAGWLGAAGLLALASLALSWLSVALGLASKSVEAASNLPMFLLLLPFLGSGFVPAATMPAGLRAFAEYQPFTPVTETLRGLLTGAPAGRNPALALAWCAAIGLGGYLWSRHLFRRHPVPATA